MKKKQIATQPILNVCGNCANKQWLTHNANYDLKGNPICLTCDFKPFHILRTATACEFFELENI